MELLKINSALISVYYKEGLEPLVRLLHEQGVKLYSTGGTQSFIEELQILVTAVENVTDYPSIFGGRVKTLHPKVFGGILYRRDHERDEIEKRDFDIPAIDLVIVDLYPFEETVAQGAEEADIIEKIDIGGISLIRAAAKNFQSVLIVSSRDQYGRIYELLSEKKGATELADRRYFAQQAFDITSHYDTAIYQYFSGGEQAVFKHSLRKSTPLRYGENPHQQGVFYGDLEAMFDQLNGKALSYNNLVDVDAAVHLIKEFQEPAFAILKHTNACGAALGNTLIEAYEKAFAADPVSAFGGVLIGNRTLDLETAQAMHSLFFEVLIAPAYTPEALELLSAKKNRILLRQKDTRLPRRHFKTLLNGVIEQDQDGAMEGIADFRPVTDRQPTKQELEALTFALKLAKHTKSNTIVLAKEDRLISSGVGQTSRVDSLKQAIEKARNFGFDLQGAVMASDAFFPFPDCVEIAAAAGITAVVQPGGSIKDQDSIDACNRLGLAMVFTGVRHFKH